MCPSGLKLSLPWSTIKMWNVKCVMSAIDHYTILRSNLSQFIFLHVISIQNSDTKSHNISVLMATYFRMIDKRWWKTNETGPCVGGLLLQRVGRPTLCKTCQCKWASTLRWSRFSCYIHIQFPLSNRIYQYISPFFFFNVISFNNFNDIWVYIL